MYANPASLYTTFTVVDILVLISTLVRLSFRLHIGRFWWEDAWATVAFVSGTAFVITQYTFSGEIGFNMMMTSCWITTVFSTVAMCAVRTSILYSAIRIMLRGSRIRTFTRIVAVFLLIFCAISVALRYYLCSGYIMPPKGTLPPEGIQFTQPATRKCTDGGVFMIFQLATDCVSDAILVILPLKLLWKTRLPRQRRMILVLFSSSVIVSILSMVHGILPDSDEKYDLSLNLETTLALIVCNLLVLVTYMYRMLQKSRGESEPISSESYDLSVDDNFTTCARARDALTFVDLDVDSSYNGANSNPPSSLRSCPSDV